MSNPKYTFVSKFLQYIRQAYLKQQLPEIDPRHYDTVCENLTEATCEPNLVRRRRRCVRSRTHTQHNSQQIFAKIVSLIKEATQRTRVRNTIVKLWNEFVAQATKHPQPAPSERETKKKKSVVSPMRGFVVQLIKLLESKVRKSNGSSRAAVAVKYLMSLQTNTMTDVEIMTALRKVFPESKLNGLYGEYIRVSGKTQMKSDSTLRTAKEEQYIARQITNLKSLLHAYSCDRSNCPVKLCAGMRKMWRHWYTCPDTSSCRLRGCRGIRLLASHFYHGCYPKLCCDSSYQCPQSICHVAFRKDGPMESFKFEKAQVMKGLKDIILRTSSKVLSSASISNTSSRSSSSSSSSKDKTKSEQEYLSPDVVDSLMQGMSEFLGQISDKAATRASYRNGDLKTASIVLDDIENATSECFPELESLLELHTTVRNLKTKRSRYMLNEKETGMKRRR